MYAVHLPAAELLAVVDFPNVAAAAAAARAESSDI